MARKKLFIYEKFQVFCVAAGLMWIMYHLGCQWFRPDDPQGPVLFLAAGQWKAFAWFGLLMCIFAGVSGLLTSLSRPPGAMAAALIGLGGLSLCSGSLDSFLWTHSETIRASYLQMMAEMLIYVFFLLAAEHVASAMRIVVGKIRPSWVFVNHLELLTEQQVDLLVKHGYRKMYQSHSWLNQIFGDWLGQVAASRDLRTMWEKAKTKEVLATPLPLTVIALVSGTAIGFLLQFVLLQSASRGQILFSLFAGFCVTAMIIEYVVPLASGVIYWLIPILVSLGFYGLAAFSGVDTASNELASASPQFMVLPIDWLTAGVGGSLFGAWLNARMREVRIFDALTESEQREYHEQQAVAN